jgi:hypothetical protein
MQSEMETIIERSQNLEKEKKKDDRKKASRLLVTVAQTGEFDKSFIKHKLLSKYENNIAYCCIAKEEHKEKGVHCHIFINFVNRIKYSYQPNTFEFLFNKPAHIAQIKVSKDDRVRALQYVKKVEDYIEFGKNDINEEKHIVVNVERYVMKMIQEGIIFERLLSHEIEKVRNYTLKHSAQIKRMILEIKELRNWERKQQLKGIKLIDKELIEASLNKEEREMIEKDSGLQKIIEHINKIMIYKGNKPFKDKHLLIWSRGVNKGKTSLVRKIMEYCPMYGFPTDQWFHGYKSNEFWGIFWNEMKLVGYDIDLLKNFFEGTPVKLAIKGSQVDKEDNPQMIMTSNDDLESMIEKKYMNGSEEGKRIALDALRARVDEACVDGYENIFFLSKLVIPIEN